MAEISGKTFIVVKHTYFESPGTPETEMIRHIRGHASAILYIRNPFPDATKIPPNTTIVEYGSTGDIIREITAPHVPGPSPLSYVKDVLFSVYYGYRSKHRFDLFVGADNLNTLAGIILRMMGRVKKVAYYVIDFTPQRFTNRIMNAIYQAINKFCCYHADYLWNVSERMIDGRASIGISRTKSAPQITVPLGCRFDAIPRLKYDDINSHDIVYFGMLREEHGPGLILDALPGILTRHPDARAIFAGDGELRPSLEAHAHALGIADHVLFTGFLDTDDDVYDILSRCGLALATYPPGDTYKTYADPGKIKIYLACALPILVTDVPPVARRIGALNAGVIVEHDHTSLAHAVCNILDHPDQHRMMRDAAVSLAREYDWDAIWTRTFEAMEF